jgi:hypothetical protein
LLLNELSHFLRKKSAGDILHETGGAGDDELNWAIRVRLGLKRWSCHTPSIKDQD